MNCNLQREGEYLTCQCCLEKVKTDKDKVKKQCKGGEGCTQQYPSTIQMISNAVTAGAEYIADGMKNASDEEIQRRASICESCELFDAVQRRCTKCGCFTSIKTVARSAQCPIGKW